MESSLKTPRPDEEAFLESTFRETWTKLMRGETEAAKAGLGFESGIDDIKMFYERATKDIDAAEEMYHLNDIVDQFVNDATLALMTIAVELHSKLRDKRIRLWKKGKLDRSPSRNW
jgi:hypothetical protein